MIFGGDGMTVGTFRTATADAAVGDPRVTDFRAKQRARAAQARKVPLPAVRVMVFYGRISAIYDDTMFSVPLQVSEGIEIFEREYAPQGWTWGEPQEDEGIGATERAIRTKKNKKREGFYRLLELLETGQAHGVMAYNSSRLARNVPDALRLCNVIEDRPYIRIYFTSSGETHNLNTADGRAAFLTSVIRAEQETMLMVENATRGRAHKARVGNPPRRSNLGFGWQEYKPVPNPKPADFDPARDRVMWPAEQVEAERAALRDGLRMVVDKRNLVDVAREWNRRGVLTREGSMWSGDAVRATLSRPMIAGYAVHQGRIVGDLRGGVDARIVDRDAWLKAMQIFGARSSGRPHVMSLCGSGAVRCGKCGEATLRRLTDDKRGARYSCHPRWNRKLGKKVGCGGNTVPLEWLDAHVKAMTIERLSSPENFAAITARRGGDVDRDAEVARLRDELAQATEIAGHFSMKLAKREMPLSQYEECDAECQRQITALRAQIDAAQPSEDGLRLSAAADVAQAWADAEAVGDLRTLQAMVAAAFPRLTVVPNGWDGECGRNSRPARIWWDGVSPGQAVA